MHGRPYMSTSEFTECRADLVNGYRNMCLQFCFKVFINESFRKNMKVFLQIKKYNIAFSISICALKKKLWICPYERNFFPQTMSGYIFFFRTKD